MGYLSFGWPSLHTNMQLGVTVRTSHNVPLTHPSVIFRLLLSTMQQPSFMIISSGSHVCICCSLLWSLSLASSLYSFPLINCRHCSLIASTSLRLEQLMTVFVKSTDATSTFSRQLCNTDSTWSSQIPSLIFNSIELSIGSFALTISFNCNMLKLNHNLVLKISVLDTGDHQTI